MLKEYPPTEPKPLHDKGVSAGGAIDRGGHVGSNPEVVRSPLPEVVDQYSGRWVAIRGDEVVADAESLEALTQNDRVGPEDLLYRVPEGGTHFF